MKLRSLFQFNDKSDLCLHLFPRFVCAFVDFVSFFLSIPVDADEIKRLGKRFRKLDLDNSGSLSVDEFMSLPELQQNPLVQRVIDIFDTDGNGEVDFKGKNCQLIFQSSKLTAIFCFNNCIYWRL